MVTSIEKKTIGLVSRFDPWSDRKAWSGTLYKLREAIEYSGYNVKWIKVNPNVFFCLITKIALKCLGQLKYWEFSGIYGWLCARSIKADDVKGCDYLFFPGEAQVIYYLCRSSLKNIPYIYYTDATIRLMVDYYWNDMPRWIIRQADIFERVACECSRLVIKASDWAIESAINDYCCPPEKTAVLEFGPNIDEKDIIVTEPYKNGELRILFSGIEWERKGGEIAIDTVKLLNERGYKVKLYLVGIDVVNIPYLYRDLKYVEYVGFLNKNVSSEYKKYIEIICKCHCLLLPTHAECAGIVFNEAAAFGLPSFTYDTGGIGNYVINGETGALLDVGSTSEDFSITIENVIKEGGFEKMHMTTLALYKNKNNWNAWGRRFSELVQTINKI